MDRKIYGIFVAGGSGTRMHSVLPKQFMPLAGETILQKTIERFAEVIPQMKMILVLPREHFSTWKDICAGSSFIYPHTLVAGGITRFHSVKAALEKVPDGAIAFVHDGVRPFVSAGLIQSMLQTMQSGKSRALIPALRMVDTLRSTEPGVPDPDRTKIVAVQTPQFFLSEDIRRAYHTLAYDISFTDDASVVSRLGIRVDLVEGERQNIKITTPEDLILGQALLSLAEKSGN